MTETKTTSCFCCCDTHRSVQLRRLLLRREGAEGKVAQLDVDGLERPRAKLPVQGRRLAVLVTLGDRDADAGQQSSEVWRQGDEEILGGVGVVVDLEVNRVRRAFW